MESVILASIVNFNIEFYGVSLEPSVEMSITVDLNTVRGGQMSEMCQILDLTSTHNLDSPQRSFLF